jgi:hypothetical protein
LAIRLSGYPDERQSDEQMNRRTDEQTDEQTRQGEDIEAANMNLSLVPYVSASPPPEREGRQA